MAPDGDKQIERDDDEGERRRPSPALATSCGGGGIGECARMLISGLPAIAQARVDDGVEDVGEQIGRRPW